MSYHHPYSPSSLGRRRLCPGSFLMEQKVKKSEASVYAAEGTMLHECIANRIDGRSWNSKSLNADQVNALESCYDWFKSEVLTPLSDNRGPEVWKWIDTEKNLGYWNGDDDDISDCVISGTVDVLIDTRDGFAVIVDWKFGRAEVSYINSILQLTGYAVLTFQAHEHISTIESYIYQPRTGTIKKGVFHRDDLAKYKETITETISACLAKDPPLEASWDACAYCRAISICPEAKDKAFGQDQAVIERPLFNTEEMDADTLGQTLDDTKVAEKFLKEVKTKCKEVMIDGQEATGWAIGERSGMKAIGDPVALAEAVSGYLNYAELLSVSTLSGVDFCELSNIVTAAGDGDVQLIALIPHAKISVPKLVAKLMEKIIRDWEANEGPDPLTMPKTEARRRAHELIEPHVIEGPKINALNRRKDS